MAPWFDEGWSPYVSVAERRKQAAREIEKLRKKGHPVAPVILEGRTIARTFWGKAWCDNLENYQDFDNRLPRGRVQTNPRKRRTPSGRTARAADARRAELTTQPLSRL